jgi:glucose-1-phosphate adenylyltransferase
MGFRNPILAIVLAGGRGNRLGPLTDYRCKPALPFGKNRLVDFALANVINSQIVNHTMILTQYMQQGLINHLSSYDLTSHAWGKSVNIVPAQQQLGDDSWYGGTANAVFQNKEMIKRDLADTVVILAADHIYKLDIRQMLAFHVESEAKFTVCGITMPLSDAAGNFGVMELDDEAKIVGFEEKPIKPKALPENPNICFASMGIYLVDKKFLFECLEEDHNDPDSEHDFGKNIIPHLIAKQAEIFGYDYNKNMIPGEIRFENGQEVQVHYWRDVGRIGPYWEAIMDLTAVVPQLNVYNKMWTVPTAWDRLSGAKFVTPDRSTRRDMCDTIVAGGVIVDDFRRLDRVVLSREVRTERHVELEGVVVLDGAIIGEKSILKNVIVEEGVCVPPNMQIGFDIETDRANGVIIDPYHDFSSWYAPIRVVTKSSFS